MNDSSVASMTWMDGARESQALVQIAEDEPQREYSRRWLPIREYRVKGLNSLSHQIIFSMSAVVLCVTALTVAGYYLFYAWTWSFGPPSDIEVDEWLPTNMELVWMALITCAGLAVGAVIAIKLSRRILMPLNSVADNLRKLAGGNLDARASAGDLPIGEAALLVDDFNNMAKRLKSLSEEQAFWNSAIAHELRTPLALLRDRLLGLAESVEADTSQYYSLLTQVEELARLVEDLRVVGLADSCHLELHLRESDLAAVIENSVRMFEPSLQTAGFELQLDLQRRPVRCDPARIRQALLALLNNIRRHAMPGTIIVHLSTRDGFNFLRVKDDGPGIEEEFTAHIFEAFQRGERSRPSTRGDSGLGLAVVRAIALAHGGAVTCRTVENGGALLELSWPD